VSSSHRPITVGWLLEEHLASVIFYPPEPLKWPASSGRNRNGVTGCPAIKDLTQRLWVVRSPYTFRLRTTYFEAGQGFRYVSETVGQERPIPDLLLNRLLQVQPMETWESPGRPVLQLRLPYVFICDRSVYIEQLPAFLSDISVSFPGLVYPGRFPIDVWPRRINFSFQWIDLERCLEIRRGEPLFYLRFSPRLRDQRVRLVEAERTEELSAFLEAIRSAPAFANNTFSLFERAAEMRPPRLVRARRNYASKAAQEKAEAERLSQEGQTPHSPSLPEPLG
jgi:hypothetical protein